MKYYQVVFTIQPCSQDARDVLSAMAAEAGFETFEETETGLTGYVQQQLFDEPALDDILLQFPFSDSHINYKVSEAEDRDWNEQWEQEGFEPIVVGSMEPEEARQGKYDLMVIHDGRHMPEELFSHLSPLTPNIHQIEIDAHMAFGTGTHETTRMICSTLLGMHLEGKRVLDCGSGTGILGICALKLGALACTAYDIDEWSTDNTRHNAVINGVDSRLTALNGDATLLDDMDRSFDVVLANINRNILLQDMERFVGVMAPGATLILSGFYQNDIPLLEAKGTALGLTLAGNRHDGEWACVVMKKESSKE